MPRPAIDYVSGNSRQRLDLFGWLAVAACICAIGVLALAISHSISVFYFHHGDFRFWRLTWAVAFVAVATGGCGLAVMSLLRRRGTLSIIALTGNLALVSFGGYDLIALLMRWH